MKSSERILTAIRGGDVDYVPLIISWNETQKMHERLRWSGERERIEHAKKMGWDTFLRTEIRLSPVELNVRQSFRDAGGKKILSQEWETPDVTLHEEINFTDNWDFSELRGSYIDLESDFRTPRYISYPFKNENDLKALKYIFPIVNPVDSESIKNEYAIKRALADEFGCPLFTYMDSGMDWLLWLYPMEEAICRAVDSPEYVSRILNHINEAKYKRLELMISLGIDGVIRRGWYEGADIWSPELLKKLAWPAIKRESDLTRNAGKVFIYTLDTGAKKIADDLSGLGIDCIMGLDPIRGDLTVAEAHEALPDITLWGGFSAPGHFGADSPNAAADAVKEAIRVYGKKRLILGMAASYRYYYPYENFEAAETMWKLLR